MKLIGIYVGKVLEGANYARTLDAARSATRRTHCLNFLWRDGESMAFWVDSLYDLALSDADIGHSFVASGEAITAQDQTSPGHNPQRRDYLYVAGSDRAYIFIVDLEGESEADQGPGPRSILSRHIIGLLNGAYASAA